MNYGLFFVGFAAGAALFLVLWLLSEMSNRDYLELKAKPENRTPFHLRGRFYYIVPEGEYVMLRPVKEILGASPYTDRRLTVRGVPRSVSEFARRHDDCAPDGRRIEGPHY